jgi:type IV fimbrial biogenesis protein FimT
MSTPEQGLTLIELLVVIALAAVITAIGIPSYQSILRDNRTAAEANALVGDLAFARSEAIKRGVNVTLCPAQQQGTDYQCQNAGTDWQGGWAVLVGNPNAAASPPLRIQGSLQSAFGSADALTSNIDPTVVTFDRYGITTNSQTIALRNAGGSSAPCLVISQTGRVRSGTMAENAAINTANCQTQP